MSAIVILRSLDYKPTSKKKIVYVEVDPVNSTTVVNMPALSFAEALDSFVVETRTADGKETKNTTSQGDIVMSGPSREKYVDKVAKFQKLYTKTGTTAVPDQTPRQVALYTGTEVLTFTASWGEEMVLKPFDYVVKDGDNFYRIASKEYKETYNEPGQVG